MNKDHGIHEEANRTTTSCAGLTPNGLPKVQEETHVFVKNSHTGVSTNCVLKKSDLYARQHKLPPRNWFALRVTYGRERTAYDYLVSMGVKAFCPMHRVAKIIKGKRRLVMQSRLPNLFLPMARKKSCNNSFMTTPTCPSSASIIATIMTNATR